MGWDWDALTTLLNRGKLTTNDLYIGNQAFNLIASDSVSNMYLTNSTTVFGATNTLNNLTIYSGSTATTTAVGNIKSNIDVQSGCILKLGDNLSLTGNLTIRGSGATLDMGYHTITANQIFLGWDWDAPITLLNGGTLTAANLYIGNGSVAAIHSGMINNLIDLANSSVLTVSQANGQLTGLTFNGTSQGNLSINDSSVLNLQFGQSRFSHWIFRWHDANSTSNWGDALTSLIGAGRISINPSNGYFLADSLGYTYIYAVAQPADFDWKGGNGGGPTDWGIVANWNPNTGVPYGKGVFLSFGAQSAANNIVDMGSSGKTVGGLIFVSATSTTIQSSGGHDLTLDNNGEISTIDVSGNHFITTPVILNNDAQVVGIGILTLSGGISGTHNLDVQGNLVASSIEVDSLTIESGATVTIQAIPGGPMGNTITAVPEPSALVLMGIGSIGLLAYAWRRRWRRIA